MRSLSNGKITLPEFKDLCDTIEEMWEITDSNIKQLVTKINKIVDSGHLTDTAVLDIADYIALKRPKKLKSIYNFCLEFSENRDFVESKYKCKHSAQLQALLCMAEIINGKYNQIYSEMEEEQIFQIYEEDSIQYIILWDKVDLIQQICETSDFDFDQIIDNIRVIDVAAQFGALNCFKFLHDNNAIVTHRTLQYAYEGGRQEIIDILEEMFEVNDDCFINAIESHFYSGIEKLQKNKNLRFAWPNCFQSYNFKFIYDQVFNGDVNMRDMNSRTPLMVACDLGLEMIISLLVENKADVNLKDPENRTALFGACIHDRSYLSIVKILVENKAELNIQDNDGYSPLIVSCITGNRVISKYLIDSKVNLNFQDKAGKTALMHAIRDCPEVATAIIDAGADISLKDNKGHSALYHACKANDQTLVKELIEVKANVNDTNNKGVPIIHSIVEDGLTSIAFYLLESGGDFNATDPEGNTLLMVSCRENNEDLVHYILDENADINIVNKEKKSALMIACLYNSFEIVKILIDNKADVNLKDEEGKTALNYACEGNGADSIKVLVENGKADIEVRDAKGWTPIMYTASYDNVVVVKQLISLKANINAVNEEGLTPMMIAAQNNASSVVELLLQSGADSKIVDKSGRTALQHAIDNQCSNVVMVLQSTEE